MKTLLRISRVIDSVSDAVGRCAFWGMILVVFIGALNTVARYVDPYVPFRLSSNRYIELQWYLFGVIFLLGGAHTLRAGAHVRVDVLYERLSVRGRAWINLLGGLLFLLPFCAVMIAVSWSPVLDSWRDEELSPDPDGLPRYWIKSFIPIGFLLLALQGLSEVIKQVGVLRDPSSSGSPGDSEPPGDLPAGTDRAEGAHL